MTLLLALAGVLAVALASRSSAADKKAAELGKPAPEFALKDHDGKTVKLSDLKGKIVVLEWFNPGCPFVERHYESKTFATMAEKYAGKGVVHLAVDSNSGGDAARNKQFAEANKLAYSILTDADCAVARAYGAKTTPHMFVIDKEGNLVYKGGIDNDPNGDKADRVNYVEKALDELLAGKTVSTPETKSYGCGVKGA